MILLSGCRDLGQESVRRQHLRQRTRLPATQLRAARPGAPLRSIVHRLPDCDEAETGDSSRLLFEVPQRSDGEGSDPEQPADAREIQ